MRRFGRVDPTARALSIIAVLVAVIGCDDDAARDATPTANASRASGHVNALDSMLAEADALFLRSTDSAQAMWVEIESRARAIGDSAAIARAITGRGQVARRRLELPEARRLGETALGLKLRNGLKSELFRSYNSLGLVAWDEGRYSDALSLFGRASESALTVGDSAKAWINVGLVRTDLGEFDAAGDALRRGRDGARAARDTVTLGRALTNLASLDIKLGDPLAALTSLESARLLFSAAGDSLGIANALGQQATAYDALGQPQRAFAALDSALRVARSQSLKKEEAEDLKILADLYAAAGDHQRALDHYQQAAAVADTLGDPDLLGTLLRDQARSHFALGRGDLAAKMARDALALHRASDAQVSEVSDLILLAELAQEDARPRDAEGHLRAARALAVRLDAAIERARVALTEARIAMQRADAGRVVRALDLARADIATAGQGAVAEAAALRLKAYARLGQLDAAAAAGRQAVHAIERTRGNYGSGELRATFAADRAGVYADLVVVLLRLGRTAEAFEIADAARGRALLDHVAAARAEMGSAGNAGQALIEADQLLRRIDVLMTRLRELEQTHPRERATQYASTTSELTERVTDARTQYEAIAAREGRGGEAMMLLGAARTSGAAVQASLDSGEVLLEYFVTERRTFIFAVRRDGMRHFATDITRDDLLQRTRLARDLMSRSRTEGRDRPVLQALHELLLRPVIDGGALRGARRVIVVRHSALAYLPFAALLDPTSGRHLVETVPVLYVPSAAALGALRGRRGGNDSSREAPIAFAPFPDRLPGTARETDRFARTLRGARSAIGRAATEGRLRDALGTRAVVHVATHGVMNTRNPLFSRLELTAADRGTRDNGRLEVHELLDLRVASPLVFLSGCETGVGDAWSNALRVGEDYTTLAQSLLFAGAGNVVATLWRIDDDAAATLAARFYASLASLPLPEALAEAQRAMLSDVSLRSPYFWAAYEATGGVRLTDVLQFAR